MRRLLDEPWIGRVGAIYCSTERKAIDGADILAEGLGIGYQKVEALGENDRSSTGYLPHAEFVATARRFLRQPDESVRGWETARHAQARIVRALDDIVARDEGVGDIAIVFHGGVGTLLYCHLRGAPIRLDLAPGVPHGGALFCLDAETRAILHGWRPIDPDRAEGWEGAERLWLPSPHLATDPDGACSKV